jgi:hypothetical protein
MPIVPSPAPNPQLKPRTRIAEPRRRSAKTAPEPRERGELWRINRERVARAARNGRKS